LDAELMASACRRPQRQLGVPGPSFQHLEVDAGGPGRFAAFLHDIHSICAAVFLKAIDPLALRVGDHTLNDRPVELRNPAGPKFG